MAKGRVEPIVRPRPRQEVLTPEEQYTTSTKPIYNIGRTIELSETPERYSRTNLDLAIQGGERALREGRALDQSNWELAGKGIGNIAGTFLFETLKMPGHLLGFENFWTESVKSLQDATQGKLFEVFTPPSVEEGDLATQLSNPYFWAKEGADGVGFLLSFMLPGQLLKAAGMGAQGATALSRLGKLQDVVVDGKRMLDAGKANQFGRLLLKSTGKTGRALDFGKLAGNIDSGLAVGINSLFEASAEGADTYDQLRSQGYSEEEAGDAASRVFKWNMGLLMLSNTFMERYLFDGFNRLTSPGVGQRITSDMISGAEDLTRRSIFKSGANKALTAVPGAIVQEGLFEEGMQTTVQQTKGRGVGEVLDKYMQNLSAMWDGTDQDATDFGKAVVLGGILGGGMGMISSFNDARSEDRYLFGSAERKANRLQQMLGLKDKEAIPGALSVLREGYNLLKQGSDVLFAKDENGKITGLKNDLGETLKDQGAMQLLANHYQDLVTQFEGNTDKADDAFIEQIAAKTGSKDIGMLLNMVVKPPMSVSPDEALAFMRHRADMEYFSKFLRTEGGEELLRAHINDMVDAMQVRYEENTGVKMSDKRKEELRNEMQEKVEMATMVEDTVNRDHHQSRYDIDYNKIVEERNPSKEVRDQVDDQYEMFLARTKAARKSLLANLHYMQERAKELKRKLNRLKDLEDERRRAIAGQIQNREEQETYVRREPAMTSPEEDLQLLMERRAGMEKDAAEFDKAIENLTKEYKKLSSASGLEKLWNAFFEDFAEGKKEEEEAAAQKAAANPAAPAAPGATPGTPPAKAKTPTREEFWDMVRGAGYDVRKGADGMFENHSPEDIVMNHNGKLLGVKGIKNPDGSMAVATYAFGDGSKTPVKVYNTITDMFNSLRGATVEPLTNTRRRTAEAAAKQAAEEQKMRNAAMLDAFNDRIQNAYALLKNKDAEIAEVEKQIDQAASQLKVYELSKKERDKLGLKVSGNQLTKLKRELNATLTKLKEQLQKLKQERADLASLKNTLEEYRAEAKKGNDTRALVEQDMAEQKALVDELGVLDPSDETMETLNGLLQEYDAMTVVTEDLIKLLQRTVDFLEETLKHHDHAARLTGLVPTQGLREKYAVTDSIGRTTYPPSARVTTQEQLEDLHRHLLKVANNQARPPADVMEEFYNDAVAENALSNLSAGTSIEDQLVAAKQELAKLNGVIEEVKKETRLLDLTKRLKQLKSEAFRFNRRFSEALATYNQKRADKDNFIPPSDPGDPDGFVIDEDPFLSNALADELLGTTGQIIVSRNGQDLTTITPEGYEVPVAHSSPFQQQFARWMDSVNLKDGYRVRLQVAYYDERDGDMESHFQRYNTDNRDSGVDVYAVVINRKGEPVKGDAGELLITGVRKAETKFPDGGLPKMNMYSLYNMFLKTIGKDTITRADFKSTRRNLFRKSTQEKLATMLGLDLKDVQAMSMGGLLTQMQGVVIEWGRNEYQKNLDNVIAQGVVETRITGVTKGHQVQIKENGQPLSFPAMSALGLSIDKNGKPENFTLVKADIDGNITEGRTLVPGYQPGRIYARTKDGQFLPLDMPMLDDSNVEVVLHLLAGLAGAPTAKATARQVRGTETAADVIATIWPGSAMQVKGTVYSNEMQVLPSKTSRLSLMTMLMNWGINTNKKSPYNIFISGTTLIYGPNRMPLKNIEQAVRSGDMSSIQSLVDFLKTKRLHMNFDVMQAAQAPGTFTYLHPKIVDGALVMAEENFFTYFMSRATTTVVPQELREKYNLPRMAQRNLQLAPVAEAKAATPTTKAQTAKPITTTGSKPVSPTAKPEESASEVFPFTTTKEFNEAVNAAAAANKSFEAIRGIVNNIFQKNNTGEKIDPKDLEVVERFFKAFPTIFELYKTYGDAIASVPLLEKSKKAFIENFDGPRDKAVELYKKLQSIRVGLGIAGANGVADQIKPNMTTGAPAVTPQPAVTGASTSSVEVQKADIEKRREKELIRFNRSIIGKNHFTEITFKDGTKDAFAVLFSENINDPLEILLISGNSAHLRTVKSVYNPQTKKTYDFDEINAKYDAELASLEQPATSTAPATTPPSGTAFPFATSPEYNKAFNAAVEGMDAEVKALLDSLPGYLKAFNIEGTGFPKAVEKQIDELVAQITGEKAITFYDRMLEMVPSIPFLAKIQTQMMEVDRVVGSPMFARIHGLRFAVLGIGTGGSAVVEATGTVEEQEQKVEEKSEIPATTSIEERRNKMREATGTSKGKSTLKKVQPVQPVAVATPVKIAEETKLPAETTPTVEQIVEENVTAEEVTKIQEETGVSTKEEVVAAVVDEVTKQMNSKKPVKATTTLQKVAARLRQLFTAMLLTFGFLTVSSFAIAPQQSSTRVERVTIEEAPVQNLASFDQVLMDQEAINQLGNMSVIMEGMKQDTSGLSYMIVDKQNSVAHLFENNQLVTTYEVGTGKTVGDSQTVTVVRGGKVYWDEGNQQTGAGIYTVNFPTTYDGVPAFSLKNERGIAIPSGLHITTKARLRRFGNATVEDNRMSYGCVNFLAKSLEDLNKRKSFTTNSKVFILPDNPSNKFVLVDGKIQFQSADPTVNRTPIRPYAAKPVVFKADNANNTGEKFLESLADNKARIMSLYPTISNDIYNQIAKIAYGVFGQESSFGTYGGPRGKFGFVKDAILAAATDYNISAGVTQVRLTSVPTVVRNEFGINDVNDYIYNTENAAIITMGLLLDMYINQIPSSKKSDFARLLPLGYSNPAEFLRAKRGEEAAFDNAYVRNVNTYAQSVSTFLGHSQTPKMPAPKQADMRVTDKLEYLVESGIINKNCD